MAAKSAEHRERGSGREKKGGGVGGGHENGKRRPAEEEEEEEEDRESAGDPRKLMGGRRCSFYWQLKLGNGGARAISFFAPVEVVLAVDPVPPGEALLVQESSAIGALDALGVPRLLQDRGDELVVDGPAAAHADHLLPVLAHRHPGVGGGGRRRPRLRGRGNWLYYYY